MKNQNKQKETLLLGKYHTYDAILFIGVALVILGIIFLGTVFVGAFTMGRASVILGIIFLLIGGIVTGNGTMLKRKALDDGDYYCDYKAEKKKNSEKELSE